MPLPQQHESLVTDTNVVRQSRQQRRQAMRAAAKASGSRRTPAARRPVKTAGERPSVSSTVPVEAALPELVPMSDLMPLPRSQSLAKPRSGLMRAIDRLLRPVRLLRRSSVPPVEDMRLLRAQLAAAQQTLDRLLATA